MTPEMMGRVDEYLAGRLSDGDLDAFEIELIENTLLQQHVSEQIALRGALRSESALLLSEPSSTLLQRIHEFLVKPAWTYSVSLALVLLIPVALLPESEKANPISGQPVAWRNVEFTRSADVAKVYAPADMAVMLSIDAYGMQIETADFRLSRDGESVVYLEGISADEQALLNLVLSSLPAANYEIELIKPDGEVVSLQLIIE
ncbi:MAG: hypothetical protein ACI8Z1_001356 [Candidatus Azotimanducaceae bacterium]|jgi:hypothetical protein